MKIYLRKKENFHPETVKFYEQHFTLTDEKEADILVINDFSAIEASDKIVACNSTGIDHIKAKEVISLRGSDLTDLTAVAELCLGMAIIAARKNGEEVRGKTLGIIGHGRIGKGFAALAETCGMEIMFYDEAHINTKPQYTRAVSLEALLTASDVVSLHITADERNRDFFKGEHFEMMKDGAIFLNSSRPWLVEEEGLKWALHNKLSCAWFDFDMRFDHENLATTSHLGGTTKESKQKSELIIAKKIWNRQLM